jgi:hypothetical protein
MTPKQKLLLIQTLEDFQQQLINVVARLVDVEQKIQELHHEVTVGKNFMESLK